jgi:hypothetical protein
MLPAQFYLLNGADIYISWTCFARNIEQSHFGKVFLLDALVIFLNMFPKHSLN